MSGAYKTCVFYYGWAREVLWLEKLGVRNDILQI